MRCERVGRGWESKRITGWTPLFFCVRWRGLANMALATWDGDRMLFQIVFFKCGYTLPWCHAGAQGLFNIMQIIWNAERGHGQHRERFTEAFYIISIMLNSLGLVFWGAVFGVRRMQLFGFCPRARACLRWRQKTMCCKKGGQKTWRKKTTEGKAGVGISQFNYRRKCFLLLSFFSNIL